MLFDIVICVGPNDYNVIEKQLEYTKKNIMNRRNIYLITPNKNLKIKDCITIDENIFPFSKKTVAKFHGKHKRNGWYLQQLIKLYSTFVIPNITKTYLVLDADTYFLKPVIFIKNNKCMYNSGYEYHEPYFDHMKKLHPSFTKIYENKSGITHHMMLQRSYIKEIIRLVESKHNDKFYNVFLKNIDVPRKSGASEYEIYFNYMLKNHSDKIIIRDLKWRNTDELLLSAECDYISYHWYKRK